MTDARRYASLPPDEPRLLEGLRLFNAGKFFESHEVWESLWHELDGPERDLLQGLIQAAAGYHHLSQANSWGAAYLFGRALARLKPWAPAHAGLSLAPFIERMAADVRRLDHGDCTMESAPELCRLR